MTKAELVAKIAKEVGIAKSLVEKDLDDINITEYSKYDNGDIIQHVFQWQR